jgi:hypothetical protein
MNDPIKFCTVCQRRRNCMLHAGGRGFPPDKAEKWLRRTCPNGGTLCQISYRAGTGIRSRWVGQQESA